MTITVLFRLDIRPGRVEDALEVLRRLLRATRVFPGNLAVAIEQEEGADEHLVVRSTWASSADHDAYLAWRSGEGAVPDLGPLLAGDPETLRLRTLEEVEPGAQG